MINNFLIISLSPHGTRVVQKLIEFYENDSQELQYFVNIFNENLLELIRDGNGNHIVIKYLSTNLPNQFLYNNIIRHYMDIATNKYGCCVIKKAIEVANILNKNLLIQKSLTNALILMCDQYGNYILQFLISLRDNTFNRTLVKAFKENIIFLAKQKFCANVIEKVKFYNTSV